LAAQRIAGQRCASIARTGDHKRVVVGLLMLALLLWALRDTVPLWMAKSMAATVELATTSERDDARVTRAFDAAMHVYSADATLEALPNQIRVRHTRLTVRAPTSDEAIELASRMSLAMASAFAKEGPATLSVDVRRRTTPVEDPTTTAAAMRCASAPPSRGFFGRLADRARLVPPAGRPRSPAAAIWWLAGGWRWPPHRSSCPATSSWRCSSWPFRCRSPA
jgi:hypothetical protein